MKSAQVASDAEHYLPMISVDDSSQHQREAAAHSNSRHGRRRHRDFRMIPNEADCQVTANSMIIFCYSPDWTSDRSVINLAS